ncbi:MAG: 4-hydroxythreonine-4-phosphate dehydrogenase PdxA [Chromatiales bacterium]|nr:4-hydroxythreonine-4-phosphate dehydrogenase PdxA [Chromatiales bacterium]
MGDPSGVGPEIVCRALAALDPAQRAETMVVGHRSFLERANALTDSGLTFTDVDTGSGAVVVESVDTPERHAIRDGTASAGGGHAAYGYVCRAVDLALGGTIDVIVTAPLNKAALHLAGHEYDGHTGLLAHLTGAGASYMLLASERLSTIHVSTHVSLAQAIECARPARILDTIRAGDAHLRGLGMRRPRIAVAGLNPHCGEGGLFGNEDQEHIEPAVAAAIDEGIEAHGPLPADTVFYRAMQGEFDLVVAQYHDQGHIPTKLIAFDTTVNVSLGLPIRRTSVDHGTAFDIAWRGIARHVNMMAALDYARRMTAARA